MYVYLTDGCIPIIILVTPTRFTRSWANTVTQVQVVLKSMVLVIVMICVWKI